EHSRKNHEIAKGSADNEGERAEQDEGSRQLAFLLVEARRDEGPDLPEDDWGGEEDAGVETHFHQNVQLFDSGGVDQRLTAGRQSSKHRRHQQPKNGLGEDERGKPEDEDGDRGLGETRSQLRLVLEKDDPQLCFKASM